MLRIVAWVAVGLAGLLVLAVLVLLAVGGERREEVASSLRKAALDIEGGGGGFDDGALIWSASDPYRITLEQLPTLEGRRLGARYRGGFLADSMSWFGVSLRQCVASCLSMPADRVLGDEGLDGIWLDVDAARPHGLLTSGVDGWDPVRERILEGLLESYDLTMHLDRELRDVRVLQAGPGWSEHVVELRGGGRRSMVSSGDGLLILQSAPAGRMLHALEQSLGEMQLQGLADDDRCNLELHWEAGDAESLRNALAEQLDLHVVLEQQEVDVAVVAGVPETPHASDDPDG